jgi:hypothetical protein
MGDLNPRRVAPYTLSKRAPSATRRILRLEAYRIYGGDVTVGMWRERCLG